MNMRYVLLINRTLAAASAGGAGYFLVQGDFMTSLILALVFMTSLILALVAVNCCLHPAGWRRAYRLGWIRGRQAMVSSIQEAQLRHMSMTEWVQAEMERDDWIVKVDTEE